MQQILHAMHVNQNDIKTMNMEKRERQVINIHIYVVAGDTHFCRASCILHITLGDVSEFKNSNQCNIAMSRNECIHYYFESYQNVQNFKEAFLRAWANRKVRIDLVKTNAIQLQNHMNRL